MAGLSALDGVTSNRLRLRQASRRAELAGEIPDLLTPAVLADLPPDFGLDGTPDAGERWLAARQAEADCFAVEDRASQELVGLVLLAPEDGLIHLGYLLRESHWGRGYASEIISALVLAMTGAPLRLVGGVAANNLASARALEKAGFRRQPSPTDQPTVFYYLDLSAD